MMNMKFKNLIIGGLLAAQAGFGQAWINELHYDNAGGDVGEFVEVFVEASFTGSLDDLRLSLYNGSDDELYGTNDQFLLSEFTQGDTIAGEGTFYFINPPSIQNGGPDGISLSVLNGGVLDSVIQFLSYEGVMGPAGDGDAVGLTSTDIGVAQTSSTPVGSSLGLTGAGSTYDEFSWTVLDLSATPGSPNTGQSIGAGLFVEPPVAAAATAVSADAVELSFTGNGADDVIIIFNETGTFSEPSGTPPAVGQPFAGGTVLSKGNTSPFTHPSLVEGTEIFYAFYSVTSSDLYSTGLFDSAIPGEIIINEEDFDGASTWVNQTVSGTDPGWDTSGGDAFISGFGETNEENHYLVSPALDFSTATEIEFSFEYRERFDGPDLQILYSLDYTGAGNPEANGTWTEIPFAFTDTAVDFQPTSPVNEGLLSLPTALNGTSNVYLAFKYTSDAAAETWILDNLRVSKGTTAFVPLPEPSEQANPFTAVNLGIDQINLSWSDAGGADLPTGYLVLANTTGVFADPIDGTPQAQDTNLFDGSAVLNVPQGSESASFSSLRSGTEYFFKIFAYSNGGLNIDYNTTTAPTASSTTAAASPEPVSFPTAFGATANGLEIEVSWSDVSGADGYVVLVNTTGTFSPPVDGIDPTEDTDVLDGSALLKIEQGQGTVSLPGAPETQYFFAIYPYSNNGVNIDFKTDGSAPLSDATTGSIPNLIISEIMRDPNAASDADGEYFEIYNAGSVDVDLMGLIIRDDGINSHTIASSVIVPGGGYTVLGRSSDPTVNGNLTVDYAHGNDFVLGNNDDEIVIVASNGVTEIDRVNYGGGALNFPGATGASIVFTGGVDDDNNDGTFWQRVNNREPGYIGSVGDLGSPGFTGTGQILPSFTFPFNVNVISNSADSSEISFEASFGNDVVVVFNTTGFESFTEPSGSLPAIGGSFAGGTLLYVGQDAPQAHTGLTGGVEVFYAIFSVSSTGEFSPAIQRSVLPGIINAEDFSSSPSWTNQSVFGDDPWDTSSGAALIDGADFDPTTFEELDPVTPDNHYLVSPEFDLSDKSGISIEFLYGEAFAGPDVQLLYSTNYSGSGDPEADGVTWTPVTVAFTDSDDSGNVDNSPTIPSGFVSLNAVSGLSSVHLAFKYTADGTIANSEAWGIDDIVVSYETVLSPTAPLDDYLTQRFLSLSDLETDTNGNGFTVIEEYFAGFGDGAGDDTIVYGIDPAGPALTLTSDLANDPDGVVVALLATSDLTAAFAPVAFTISSVDNGDGTFTRSYTETTPPSEADNRFYRLSITVEVD